MKHPIQAALAATAATIPAVRAQTAPQPGDSDVCLQCTAPLYDPYYTVETLQLEEAK